MHVDDTPAVPRLESDPSDQHRRRVPREDTLIALWRRLRLAHGVRPAVGALAIGGLAVGLSVQHGAAQHALGMGVAYATYRMLRYGLDLRQALTETVQLERAIT